MHALAAHTMYLYFQPQHLFAREGWVWIISGLFPTPLLNHMVQCQVWSTGADRVQTWPDCILIYPKTESIL